MGVIEDSEGRRATLDARTLIGRARTCLLRFGHAQVSAEHACVFWHHGVWCLRDLGSTNGTWVGGERLEPGARRELAPGASIVIGTPGEAPVVTLADASPPGIRAVEVGTGGVVAAVGDLLYLPSEHDPVWTVYDDGARWTAEREGVGHGVEDQGTLEVGARRWRLELPPRRADDALSTTESGGAASVPLELCRLRFRVSRDEEYVELAVLDGRHERVLAPRSFHYLLLTLARRRAEDAAAGTTPPGEHGWTYVDDLAASLGTTKPKVNLDVCRARQQLAAAGIEGAGRIVERRSSTHQIRIGVAALDIDAIR